VSTTAKPEVIVRDVAEWARTNDPQVKAAVQLLLEHDTWFRRRDFLDAAVVRIEGGHYVRWSAARDAFNEGVFNRASSTELAVLDLAIALGMDVYRFSSMGRTNKATVLDAVAAALASSQ